MSNHRKGKKLHSNGGKNQWHPLQRCCRCYITPKDKKHFHTWKDKVTGDKWGTWGVEERLVRKQNGQKVCDYWHPLLHQTQLGRHHSLLQITGGQEGQTRRSPGWTRKKRKWEGKVGFAKGYYCRLMFRGFLFRDSRGFTPEETSTQDKNYEHCHLGPGGLKEGETMTKRQSAPLHHHPQQSPKTTNPIHPYDFQSIFGNSPLN